MKRSIITLVAILCTVATMAAPKKIIVNTAEEFINALGSNREIIVDNMEGLLLTPTIQQMIDAGTLKKYDPESRTNPIGVFSEEEFDGPQLVLLGFKNLTISSNSDSRLSIEVTPRYVNVLTFVSCNNIKFRNLRLGHTEEGNCTNGVLAFKGCHDISITNCELFGCGTEGVELRQSDNFTMTDSEIFHCSYYIMHIYGSRNCKFLNCAFYNNKEFDLVNVDDNSEDVLFDHCVFTKNEGLLFNIDNTDKVNLHRCIIQHDGELGNGFDCAKDCIFLQ